MGQDGAALTKDELLDFIQNRMRMSHVYQPLLIRLLLESGSQGTVRQLALGFVGVDEAQIRLYEERIKKMPVRVLRSHGVVEVDGDLVKLNVERLTYEERAELKANCEQKISDFIQQRGLDPYGPYLLDFASVSEQVRYDVLKRDEGRCVLCGASGRDGVRLEVDHIVPRSKGGSNEPVNLQTLCAPCNRGKSNRDDTDFRN